MKAIALIACVAALGLASCKKTYSCNCTEVYNDDMVNYSSEETYPVVAKKKDKQSECDKYETGAYQTYEGSARTCTAN
jgi:hypothetical protein